MMQKIEWQYQEWRTGETANYIENKEAKHFKKSYTKPNSKLKKKKKIMMACCSPLKYYRNGIEI